MRRIFRLDGKGSGAALGPLESQAMELVWELGNWVSVTDVHERLSRTDQTPAYSTIKAVLTNLTEKGHLRKRSAGRANQFKAVQSREAFQRSVVGDVVTPLMLHYRNPLLAHIVDRLEDDAGIDELERLLAEKKAQRRA